jgi:hypothetical protein
VPDLFPGPVLASLRADPDRPAFEIGPRTVSRGDLLAMVRRLTAALRDAGLGPGKGVGLVLSLSAEAYATYLAAHAPRVPGSGGAARMEPGTTRPCPRSPGRCGHRRHAAGPAGTPAR